MRALNCYGGVFDNDGVEGKLAELAQKIKNPNLWNDAESAKQTMQAQTKLQQNLDETKFIENELADIGELLSLARTENDKELEEEALANLKKLYQLAEKHKYIAYFNEPLDGNDCYLEVHPGAGGVESQDWAEMLLRMYSKWARNHHYGVESISETAGEEAGIKSATIKICGANVYGWLKAEAGVHRLVRISPFDSNARRHTSFASIGVYPVIDDKIEIEIDLADVRVDTYRARGAGGQHVNTTDSAVRLTHQPSGIAVQCQNERSQHKNRATAWGMLRARLYEAEVLRRDSEKQASLADRGEIGWGNQIRSYVLQPYQMVKDYNTNMQSGNPQKILDGELDGFLSAALSKG